MPFEDPATKHSSLKCRRESGNKQKLNRHHKRVVLIIMKVF